LPEWISAKEAAEYTGYTRRHIRYLLASGLVEGQRFGRDWFTTKLLTSTWPITPGQAPRRSSNPDLRYFR
jgi:excisionase family DNA binding protein